MEAAECGAAALAIVLESFGRIVPLEDLRADCGVSRDGSTAANLARAARLHGLAPHAYRREPRDLPGMPLPQVLWWELNHFVVVEGFGRDRIYLNDPATGPRTVSWDELDRSFAGVVLTFERGTGWEPGGTREGLVTRLRSLLGKVRRPLAFVALAGVALAIPGLAVPALTRLFVDEYLIAQRPNVVVPVVVALGGAALVTAALVALQQGVLRRLQAALGISTGAEFVWRLLHLPMRFFAQRLTGDLAWRASLGDQVSSVVSGQLASSFAGLVTVPFYLVAMAFFDPVIALVALVSALGSLAVLRLAARRRRDLMLRVLREQAQLQAASATGILGIETLKASGGEDEFFSRWSGKLAALTNASQAQAVPTQRLAALPTLITGLTSAAVLGFGGLRVIDGDISVGTLVALQLLLAALLAPLTGFVTLAGQLQVLDANLARLSDVLRAKPDPAPAESAAPGSREAKLAGRVELRDVSFGYKPIGPPLIDSLSLAVEPGRRLAIVGPTGSGKSTLARLIAGLYAPWAGAVLLDGEERGTIPREILAESVALVDQEIVLFEGGVVDNVTLWDSAVAEGDVIRACKDAAVHEAIAARPDGYGSRVEEDGRNFSGGQRQRLEIARALVRNPAVLVLDEATSSLDPLVEREIDENLRRRGCTVVIVAHRLSTIRDADEIIVLDSGRIEARGTHDELMEAGGLYARLIESGDV